MARVHFRKTVNSIEGMGVGPSKRSEREIVWFSLPDYMENPEWGYRLFVGLPTLQNSEGNISFNLLPLSTKFGEKPMYAYLGKPQAWEWKRPANVPLIYGLNQWLLEHNVSEQAAGELIVCAGEFLSDLALVFHSDLLDSTLEQVHFKRVDPNSARDTSRSVYRPMPKFFIIGNRPVKVIPTDDGGEDILAFKWDTGEFGRNMSYSTRVLVPDNDVDRVSEEVFNQEVAKLKMKLKPSEEVKP